MKKKSETIRESLKKARKDLGLKQSDIAYFLNASESMISHLEKHQKNNIFIHYIYFLRYKGFDLNELFEDQYAQEMEHFFNQKNEDLKK